ncbi:MAG: hypothetical protein ABII01_03440 [Candidatus Woesearchaeota archaeon]
MSDVCLILIKNNKIFGIKQHYRDIEKIIKQQVKSKHTLNHSIDLDGGFIILDCDKKQVLNNQMCFDLDFIKKDYMIFN